MKSGTPLHGCRNVGEEAAALAGVEQSEEGAGLAEIVIAFAMVVVGGGAGDAQRALQAASLETLANLVAVGYGTTLAPKLAAGSMESRGVVMRALAGKASRTIRLASRGSFPRPKALQAVARVIRESVAGVL